MAITNAQQFKQLVNPPMKGNKRPGYRGDDAYGWHRLQLQDSDIQEIEEIRTRNRCSVVIELVYHCSNKNSNQKATKH